MFKGLLTVSGSIELPQFWPTGGSDADTASITVNSKSFEFTADPSKKPRRTRVFEGAKVGTKLVIRGGGKVTVRLQGIDAPELHFPPVIKGVKGSGTKYRQLLGETSTAKLRTFATNAGPTSSLVRWSHGSTSRTMPSPAKGSPDRTRRNADRADLPDAVTRPTFVSPFFHPIACNSRSFFALTN